MQITVLHNQTLSDIAVRHCGTMEALVDIAILNNISITAQEGSGDLVPGQILKLPTKDYGYQEVINYFVDNKINPATALTENNIALTEGNSGIGFWELENNFIVQ